jgi:hypothetical protein
MQSGASIISGYEQRSLAVAVRHQVFIPFCGGGCVFIVLIVLVPCAIVPLRAAPTPPPPRSGYWAGQCRTPFLAAPPPPMTHIVMHAMSAALRARSARSCACCLAARGECSADCVGQRTRVGRAWTRVGSSRSGRYPPTDSWHSPSLEVCDIWRSMGEVRSANIRCPVE